MLQSIRDKAQGWIAWAIVILITIPFALFGIQQYLGHSGDPVVVTVNGTDIKQSDLEKQVRQTRDNLRLMLGSSYNPSNFQGKKFEQQVLKSLITETLLRQAASNWDLRSSDAQIRAFIHAIPAFQKDGKFDYRLYEASVRNRGMSSGQFEELVGRQLVQEQLQAGVRNTAFATATQFDTFIRLSGEQRTISYARIPAKHYLDPKSVTDEQIQAYYDQHPADYTLPERVKLQYVQLSAKALEPQIQVTEQALKDYFAAHKQKFVTPQQREVRHILIATNGKNDAQQKAKAEAILKQLRNGANFAELAKKDSDDTGSAADGGNLGWIGRNMMVKPFEDAAFSLKKGQISNLVKTQYGYHIIQVMGIRGGNDVKFADVKSKVEQDYRLSKAQDLYYKDYEKLSDTAYENPTSLQPAADQLGLPLKETGWVTRKTGLSGALASPKVYNAAFSDDVLGQGNNSDLLDLAPTDAVVVRVADQQPQRVQALSAVRDQVVAAVAAQQATDKAAEAGVKALAELRAGQTLQALAARHDWKVEQQRVGRDAQKLPAEVVDEGFKIALPKGAKQGYGGVVSAGGNYMLVEASDVTEGDPAKLAAAQKRGDLETMQAQMGAADFAGVVEALRAEAKIKKQQNGN